MDSIGVRSGFLGANEKTGGNVTKVQKNARGLRDHVTGREAPEPVFVVYPMARGN